METSESPTITREQPVSRTEIYTVKTWPYRRPFHKQLLKKTRRIYWYLGGARIHGTCYQQSGWFPLTVQPREPSYMEIDRMLYKKTGDKNPWDRGVFFYTKISLAVNAWECNLLPEPSGLCWEPNVSSAFKKVWNLEEAGFPDEWFGTTKLIN